jgi:hypothetical protein
VTPRHLARVIMWGVTTPDEGPPAFERKKTTLQKPPFYATINLFWVANHPFSAVSSPIRTVLSLFSPLSRPCARYNPLNKNNLRNLGALPSS